MATDGNVSNTWKQKGLMVIVVGAGVLCAAILGLYRYVIATMKPLHLNAQDVKSVAHSAPVSNWAGARWRRRGR